MASQSMRRKLMVLLLLVISNVLYVGNGIVIGIDLGTSYSCVGIMVNGKIEIIPNHHGNRVTPSIVSFTNEEILAGDHIYEYGNPFIWNRENTVYETKRIIGRKYNEQIQKYFESLPFDIKKNESNSKPVINVNHKNKSYQTNAEEIASMILSEMKQTAEVYMGRAVNDAVITVPAHFNDDQRYATKDAATIAGLNTLRIIDEPVAAAIAYGLDTKQKDSLILVYHLGGNTLDVSLLELDEGIFEVLSNSHNDNIGGKNFDEKLLTHFIKIFKRKYKIDITNNIKAKERLRRELEKAKRALSFTTQVRVEIESFVENIDFSETITRARFEELNNDLFRETMKSIDTVLKDTDIGVSEIDEIVLSGGSTRILKIQKLIKDYFNGKEPNRDINPDEVVAYGAAKQAAILAPYASHNPHRHRNTHRHRNKPRRCYNCVDLNGQSIDIDINNNYASITYSFEFENVGNGDSQIQYEMAIDSGAYISHFIGEIDGEIYKGITKEKKKAAKEYKKAIKDKKNAILVSQDHDANVFKIETNIQSKSKAILNITVQQLLVRTFGFYELSLDISNIDNNFDSKSNEIPIKINLTNSNELEEIEIPFGRYDMIQNDKNSKIIQAEIRKQGNNELSYFIFRYKSKNENGENNEMIFDPKSNTFLHRFGYDEDVETNNNLLPRRVVFVLDKSGSMWGIWKEAQKAIIGATSNIKQIDRFGIVLFDSNVYPQIIKQGNKEYVDKMIKYMNDQRPGSATNLFGGIEKGIKLIIEDGGGKKNDEYVNQIIFVTDGVANVGVYDPDEMLQRIYDINSKLSKQISIFGIGIGADSGNNWVNNLNYPLIRQISIQNGGFDKRIKQSETKQSLEKYYKILESPQLSYIDINYESEKYEINKLTQNKFNTLYTGTDIVICGKFEKKTNDKIDGSIKSVIASNKRIEKEFVLNDDNKYGIDIERIWAYLSLKNYENLLLQNDNNVNDVMRRLINENALNLALTFNLVTPWTSMIVVEEKKDDKIDINDDDNDGITINDDKDRQNVEYAADIDDDDEDEDMDDDTYYNYDYDYGAEETSGILLLDVTPLSLGIAGYDGTMNKLIEKNSVIPTKKSIQLKGNRLPQVNISSNNNIPAVIVRIVQGERVNVSDNRILGEYILNGKYDESINIEIIFEIDANGILNVATIDDINGHNDITIPADKGRPSQEEIDEMLRASEDFAEEDARIADAVNAKNELESNAYILKDILDDDDNKLNDKLSDKDREILLQTANDIIDWLHDNMDGDVYHYKEKQQEFDDIIKPILPQFYENPDNDDDDDDDYYTDHEDL